MHKILLASCLVVAAYPAIAREVHHHERLHHARYIVVENPMTQAIADPSGPVLRREVARDGQLDAMIARHAAANGVPESLVRRVVMRESGGNARAVNHGALGIMQIKHATARGMGYQGSASGLFDPETNMTYAVRYLAGAFRAAGGDADRAVSYYARGYYEQAKRQRLARVVAENPMQAYAMAPVESPTAPPVHVAANASVFSFPSNNNLSGGTAVYAVGAAQEAYPVVHTRRRHH